MNLLFYSYLHLYQHLLLHLLLLNQVVKQWVNQELATLSSDFRKRVVGNKLVKFRQRDKCRSLKHQSI